MMSVEYDFIELYHNRGSTLAHWVQTYLDFLDYLFAE